MFAIFIPYVPPFPLLEIPFDLRVGRYIKMPTSDWIQIE
jgi:hypothetical protein